MLFQWTVEGFQRIEEIVETHLGLGPKDLKTTRAIEYGEHRHTKTPVPLQQWQRLQLGSERSKMSLNEDAISDKRPISLNVVIRTI